MKDYIDGYKVKPFVFCFRLKIYFNSYSKGECRLLTTESPEISTLVSQALEGLKERQVLFK